MTAALRRATGGVFVADETNGSWGNAIVVPGTAAVSGDSGVDSVSCGAPGVCVVGGYHDGHGGGSDQVAFVAGSGTRPLTVPSAPHLKSAAPGNENDKRDLEQTRRQGRGSHRRLSRDSQGRSPRLHLHHQIKARLHDRRTEKRHDLHGHRGREEHRRSLQAFQLEEGTPPDVTGGSRTLGRGEKPEANPPAAAPRERELPPLLHRAVGFAARRPDRRDRPTADGHARARCGPRPDGSAHDRRTSSPISSSRSTRASGSTGAESGGRRCSSPTSPAVCSR